MTSNGRAGKTAWAIMAGIACLIAARAHGQSDEFEAGRALWVEAGIASYTYGYHKFCECHGEFPPETVVTVREGAVVRVHHLYANSSREVPAREGSLGLYWTVEELLSLVRSAISRDAAVRVSYDDTLGYPTRLYIDYFADAVGDEVDLRLTRFEVVAQ